MVVLTLLTAGVGLALDAYAERQSVRDQRRNATLLQQDISHDVGTSTASTRRENELDALRELQNYADFQTSLSDKILDGVFGEDNPMVDGYPQHSAYQDDYFIPGSPEPNSRSQPRKGALLYPVVIPQDDGHKNENLWPRAYIPSLMDSGIDQQSFLAFIDSFNQSLGLSPLLDVVNVFRIASATAREDLFFNLSATIPAAVQLAKHAQPDVSTNKFIGQANDMLFRARGLFAMIVTLLPESPSQTLVINSENHFRNKQQKQSSEIESSNKQTEFSAKSEGLQDKPMSLPNRKLKQMGNFIAAYSERRPRFSRGTNLQSSYLEQDTKANTSAMSLHKNLAHRRGPLSAFSSSIVSRHNNMEAQKRKKRRFGPERPLEEHSGILRASTERAPHRTDSSGSIGHAAEAKVTENRDVGIQTGVLYLVVVNDIEIEAKRKGSMQPPSRLREWDENEWDTRKDTISVHNANSRIFPYEHDIQTAPPAYDVEAQFADGRDAFGF
ncbi:hypothetical protein BKA64DRAFT_776582 [Cadophora sp. MPI-SDFR-AT-0126]|nr:hypothetical protein BKA64DRAFT_776582 [Leotiomycetes sp. MPI-SDFR-AT-0126]